MSFFSVWLLNIILKVTLLLHDLKENHLRKKIIWMNSLAFFLVTFASVPFFTFYMITIIDTQWQLFENCIYFKQEQGCIEIYLALSSSYVFYKDIF